MGISRIKLTPARRFFYGLSICGFVLGMIAAKGVWILCAFIILNYLLALELANKLTTRDELEIAREIQISLEPEQLPEIPWLSISFSSKPAKIGGGDFFNVVKRNDNQMLSIVGDVAGKGIPAACASALIGTWGFRHASRRNPCRLKAGMCCCFIPTVSPKP